jgi:hypothetical protein
MKKKNTLKVVKVTFLEKVDINEYFKSKLIDLLNKEKI